jgi:hypothetical protein
VHLPLFLGAVKAATGTKLTSPLSAGPNPETSHDKERSTCKIMNCQVGKQAGRLFCFLLSLSRSGDFSGSPVCAADIRYKAPGNEVCMLILFTQHFQVLKHKGGASAKMPVEEDPNICNARLRCGVIQCTFLYVFGYQIGSFKTETAGVHACVFGQTAKLRDCTI